jgi:hypothetical protein
VLDGEDETAHPQDRQDAAEVIDGKDLLARLPGQHDEADDKSQDDKRKRDEEYRSPPEVLEQPTADQRAESRNAAAQPRPEGDRPHAGAASIQGADQRQRRREEQGRRESAGEAGVREEVRVRRPRGQHGRGNRQDGTRHKQQLAAVPVADGAQVENSGRQPQRERVGDGRELVLGGAEVGAYRRQCHVSDAEVDIRDDRTRHQRQQYQRTSRWPLAVERGRGNR